MTNFSSRWRKDLYDAAALSDDPAFAKFLSLRADALLSDDYYPSDIAWLDLENPKFDVIFAPYETYLDDLLGVKTSYGASVMIRNEAESKKLASLPEIRSRPAGIASARARGLAFQARQAIADGSDGRRYRAGDLLHGYQAVADNLPNDPRIHEEKGSKKIFWKNFMDARVNYIILPLAKRADAPRPGRDGQRRRHARLRLMHEISHGLGPAYARTAAGKTDIREAIGPQYSALEEAKADVVGECGREVAGRPRRFPKGKAGRGVRVVCRRGFSAPSASESPKRMAPPR